MIGRTLRFGASAAAGVLGATAMLGAAPVAIGAADPTDVAAVADAGGGCEGGSGDNPSARAPVLTMNSAEAMAAATRRWFNEIPFVRA